MEAQRQHFAIIRLQRVQHGRQFSRILAELKLLQRRWAILCNLEWTLVFAGLAHFIHAGHRALTRYIDHQVARNGKNPGIETRLAVVPRSTPQYSNPYFLEEV